MDNDDLADTSFLRPVDVQRLAVELNVDGRAANRARLQGAERSSADAAFVLDAETKVNALRLTAEQDIWKRLDTLQQLMLSLGARVSFAKCKNESEADLNDMRIVMRNNEGELAERSAFYQQELKLFEEYRFHRKLSGPAKPVPPPFKASADLVFIWMLESGLNMYFFQVGEKGGAFGALILSLLISAVNIGMCWSVGYYFTKLLNSVSLLLKLLGGLVSAIFLPFLALCHYGLAQYRAQEQIAGDAKQLLTSREYLDRTVEFIFSHPFEFTDLISILLFIISFGFGVYAWKKGYSHGDPYPGYTKRYENYKTRRHHFENLQADILDRLAETRDRVVQRISDFLDDIGPSLVAMEQNSTTAAVQVGHLHSFRESCSQAQVSLLNRYFAAEGSLPPDALRRTADMVGEQALRERLDAALDGMRKAVAMANETAKGAKIEADHYRKLVIEEIMRAMAKLDAQKGTDNGTPT